MTGAGVPEILDGIEEWLPAAEEATDAPTSATVFKINRLPTGEKIVYVRVFAGSLVVRQQINLIQRRNRYDEVEIIEERITGIDRFVFRFRFGYRRCPGRRHRGTAMACDLPVSDDFIGENDAGIREDGSKPSLLRRSKASSLPKIPARSCS